VHRPSDEHEVDDEECHADPALPAGRGLIRPWPFDRLTNPRRRLIVKEPAPARIASQNERVPAPPHARRIPRHPRTIHARIHHLTFWLNWLHERRITTLAAVTQDHCEAFPREYGVVRDKESGAVLRNKAASGLRTVVSTMQDITDYGELLSVDRHRPGFRPWGKRSPRVVTGAPSRPQAVIKTEPLGDDVLRPLSLERSSAEEHAAVVAWPVTSFVGRVGTVGGGRQFRQGPEGRQA
jgi:hypothetical protein